MFSGKLKMKDFRPVIELLLKSNVRRKRVILQSLLVCVKARKAGSYMPMVGSLNRVLEQYVWLDEPDTAYTLDLKEELSRIIYRFAQVSDTSAESMASFLEKAINKLRPYPELDEFLVTRLNISSGHSVDIERLTDGYLAILMFEEHLRLDITLGYKEDDEDIRILAHDKELPDAKVLGAVRGFFINHGLDVVQCGTEGVLGNRGEKAALYVVIRANHSKFPDPFGHILLKVTNYEVEE